MNDRINNLQEDPRLTAYVLGELDADDAAALERELASDPAARALVDDLRATAGALREELAAEPCPALTPRQRRAIEQGEVAEPVICTFRFPRLWIGSGLAAAAALAFALIIITPPAHLPSPGQESTGTAGESTPRDGKQARDEAAWLGAPLNEPGAAMESRSRTATRERANDSATMAQMAQSQAPPAHSSPSSAAERLAPDDSLKMGRSAGRDADGFGGSTLADRNINGVPPASRAAEGDMPGRRTPPSTRPAPPGVNGRLRHEIAAATTPPAVGESATRAWRASPFPAVGGRGDERQHRRLTTENYAPIIDNPFRSPGDEPLSTFAADVDTASYANVRRFLRQGQLPPPDAVRIEEMVNYFPYAGAAVEEKETAHPIAAKVETAAAPWNPQHRLARVTVKARDLAMDKRPATNLVFLIDVSGSMRPDDKLPLLKEALTLLVDQLHEDDRLAIVTYAGESRVLLDSTYCTDKAAIKAAIASLSAGGSTHGSAGIATAYEIASNHFIQGGVNRVILATDGDFNVGISDEGGLLRLIEQKRASGVFLSVLGVGQGNLQDAKMELLANKGNGHYAYLDSVREARKVLVKEASSTLITVAKDVKLQIEFNPQQVGAYRQIGYENRVLAKEDFNDDTKDAGELGAGHVVTALYEIMPAGSPGARPRVDALRYQAPAAQPTDAAQSGELLTLKIRYKLPEGDESRLIEVPVLDSGAAFDQASEDLRFAAAVAAFGMILRDSPYKGTATLPVVLDIAEGARAHDPDDYRAEFISLVESARKIAESQK
jgi:Ca-activated chloride channel family protein